MRAAMAGFGLKKQQRSLKDMLRSDVPVSREVQFNLLPCKTRKMHVYLGTCTSDASVLDLD